MINPAVTHIRCRATVLAAVLSIAMFAVSSVQAFPALNLTPGTPDIVSLGINVDYIGNSAGGVLLANGTGAVLFPNMGPSELITGGTFNLFALLLDPNSMTESAVGQLSITGTIPSLGFNSGTLLQGDLSSFGTGLVGDPLEFLFDITGGDAAGIFGGAGSTAGVILNNSGYMGSFAAPFSNVRLTGVADTFAVPEPGTMALFLMGGGLLVSRRRKT